MAPVLVRVYLNPRIDAERESNDLSDNHVEYAQNWLAGGLLSWAGAITARVAIAAGITGSAALFSLALASTIVSAGIAVGHVCNNWFGVKQQQPTALTDENTI